MINASYWWVRGLDFPRLQLLLISLVLLILSFLFFEGVLSLITSFILIFCIATDVYRVAPYTRFFPKESISHTDQKSVGSFSLLVANVYVNNSNSDLLLKLISEVDPDVVLLLEPDSRFEKKCRSLEEKYKHTIKIPQDNTYGMLFYSKLKIIEHEIKHLIDPKVPSIFAKLQINSNESLHFIGLHPRPPRPSESHSDQRDGELMEASYFIEKHSDEPLIVAGDLNDVAWSHTTRLFTRTSQILDPRIGRGMFNSFPTYLPFMRFPLDHVFHTDSLMIKDLKRLGDVGSDHFPIYTSFAVLERESDEQEPAESDQDDVEERKELHERGEKWEGPFEEPDKEDE